jgi:predicted RNase H-like nuclease
MPYQRAMIDVPIGLNMAGHRKCDVRARELVGSSVFFRRAPGRELSA